MLEHVENRILIEQLFKSAKLTIRERRILDWRYGLSDGKLTLDECGKLEGVQKERIRQIEAKALRRLRQCPAARKLGTSQPAYYQPRIKPQPKPEPAYCPATKEPADGTHLILDNGGDAIVVRCDKCSCKSAPLVQRSHPRKIYEHEIFQAKARAITKGWQCTPTTDICPDCLHGNPPTPAPATGSPPPLQPLASELAAA